MQTLRIYTIKDTKAECYLPPFTMRTDGEAIRAFDDIVNRPDSTIHSHPEDYALFFVGTFDQVRGTVVGYDAKSLGCGIDFVKPVNK